MNLSNTRFYLGTTRGVLLCTTDKISDVKIFKNNETTEVTAIAQGRHEEEIVLGYGNGNVDIFDAGRCCFTRKIDNLEGGDSISVLHLMTSLNISDSAYNEKFKSEIVGICLIKHSLIIAKHDGVINIWKNKRKDFFSLNLNENATLNAMVHNDNRENMVGTGGEANDYKLWNIETKQCVFKAKSLGHDHLQLPIPTTVTGICFFNSSHNLAACCTKEGRVLLYDDRAQRKPIANYLHEKASYTTISSAFRDLQVFCGSNKGYMQWLDLRCPSKALKTYTSCRGAVMDIACDSVSSCVASVSLDKHLRIHKIETKELIQEFYMKQGLSKLLIQPVVKQESDEEDEEYEEMFNKMEDV